MAYIRSFRNYVEAEDYCNEWSGTSGEVVSVIQNFDRSSFRVMLYTDALDIERDNDAEIIWTMGPPEEGES